jgi:APA family basic amino acid/polyamine antiporter
MEKKRTLKRQLSLIQVIMLGTAGTLGSGVFVLTGHAAAVAGPAAIIVNSPQPTLKPAAR